ncbi:MAG: hypothetical protein KC486_36240, partial [Myxococcales bacterium]|nr:hypothetical protein [Myxococcales bacterium]
MAAGAAPPEPPDRGDAAAPRVATRQGARLARQHRHLAALDTRRLQRRYRLTLAGAWAGVTGVLSALLIAARGNATAAEGLFITSVVAVVVLPLLARSAIPEWLLERTLRAADEDAALATGHLSPRLGALVESTRILRLAIEAADPEDSDAERGVWAWIAEVREIDGVDRALLQDLGLSVDGVEAALLAEVERP